MNPQLADLQAGISCTTVLLSIIFWGQENRRNRSIAVRISYTPVNNFLTGEAENSAFISIFVLYECEFGKPAIRTPGACVGVAGAIFRLSFLPSGAVRGDFSRVLGARRRGNHAYRRRQEYLLPHSGTSVVAGRGGGRFAADSADAGPDSRPAGQRHPCSGAAFQP